MRAKADTTRKKVLLMDPFGSAELVQSLLGPSRDTFQVVEASSVSGHLDAYAILIGPEHELSAEEVGAMPDLRLVVATSTGVDHIPIDTVSARGAWTTTTAGYCTAEVAEHAFSLLVSGLRRIPQLDAQVRAGQWDVEALAPRRIAGSSVALIGFGRIAQALARHLIAMGVRVRALDPLVPEAVFAGAGVERADTLHDAVSQADAISVHVPLLPETERLIDSATIAAMRPGAFVVNVARGGLIDEEALISAIESGQLSGAGLDVFPIEPLPQDDPLRDAPGVLLGPHGAWYSPNAQQQLFALAVRSLLDVHHGSTPYGMIAAPAVTDATRAETAPE